ncbi:hypothetical protein HFC64_02255 [Saccharolobus solfataricus]|nr:hypothetical protein [Saccharolobus solfataricus]QPG48923.1 hypothetical protein HFC64_02255 [Saccharolobus solfataricus]
MTFLFKGIECEVYKITSVKLNYRAKFTYTDYYVEYHDNFLSVSEIANKMLKIKEIGHDNGRTLEDSVRELMNVVPAQKVCKHYICGKADFVREGIPGEIKTFKEEVNPIYEEKGILQAVFYAMLYGTKMSEYVSAIYEEDLNNEDYAIIKRIDFHRIILRKLSLKYLPKVEVVA